MTQQLLLDEMMRKNGLLTNQLQQLAEKERELFNQLLQLSAFFESAPVELYIKDAEGRYLKINKQFEKIFGVKNEDLVGKFPNSAHHPELAEATRKQDLAVLNTGKVLHREEKIFLTEDSLFHTLLTIKFPVFDNEGIINGLGAIATDITNQKQTEERFLSIINTIDCLVWEFNIITDEYTYISPQAENLLGYPTAIWEKPGFWIESMHPEDRVHISKYRDQCLGEERPNYECEYRTLTEAGRIIWFRSLISVEYQDGKPRWLRGLLVDITQRKNAEGTIRLTESRFKTMFMSAPVGMLLADLNTSNLLDVNPAYTKIVGRSVDEIGKLGWQAMTHPDDLKENKHHLEQLRQGKVSQFKMLKRFIKFDGSIVWTELTAAMIADQGDVKNPQYLAIVEDITERKLFEEKIWHQANFDLLTGLPNRSMLSDRLAQSIKKAQRDASEFAILIIDLDQFKDVNDTLGHDRGDELLIEVAKRIIHCVRESDTVARLGGDEFIIILSELSFLSGVGMVAQNIIDALVEPFHLGKDTAYISASIGVTIYPQDATDAVSLIKNADQAMYAAKNQGRNCYHFFTHLMQQKAQQRMSLVNDLRSAIKNEEFILYYQPIVELESGNIFKAEALIRWQQPDRGLVSPADFIPIAEQTRMIVEIGDWVFLQAAKQAKHWNSLFKKEIQISINASPIQFENPIDVPWQNCLDTLSIDGQSICIEITEGLLMTPDQSVLDTLLAFRDAGIQVSLDDFGTGYSSLSYLRKFDIDYLKIDQSFVQNLDHDSDDLALCAAIVVMAHTLGIKVIAEGIETQLQKDLLMSIDCDFGQGYLFSRPVPAEDFEQLVGTGF